MNSSVRTTLQPMRAPMANDKAEIRGSLGEGNAKAAKDSKSSTRARKLALQQDVDKLKKQLRHEENIHRALERAFNRPLGALPRLPSYLPPCILSLVAEVAVLEEEIVRLEEQVVCFRQDLYQEAVYMSSSKNRVEHSAHPKNADPIENHELDNLNLNSVSQTVGNPVTPATTPTRTIHDKSGKENQSCINSSKISKQSATKGRTIKKLPKRWKDCQRQELMENEQSTAEARNPSSHEIPTGDDSPNIISENILKCLSSILLRMSSVKNPGCANERTELWDPYGIYLEFGKRDVGPYKQLCAIEVESFNPNQTSNSLFLLRRLRLLLGKLASINLEKLSHQEKLAFWINIYNSCMMNAIIENGIPESPELFVALMRKATINVGGHLLSATTIEHCILRLPRRLKSTRSKGSKNPVMTARSKFGLELSEPLVTFALSCGTWSSPPVRVYTASQVENELEVAKGEYLQEAVGISTSKFAIPKLLNWYLLDFAKDLESLLDWICLQLPSESGKEAFKLLEKRIPQPLSQFVQVMPYEFSFRYLLCT